MDDEDLRSALNHALCGELDAAVMRIVHCVNQLSEEEVWFRPPSGTNAVGNLLLHLTGNLRQMIASNLTGAPDDRDRAAEFASRDPVPTDQLVGALLIAVMKARAAVLDATDARLCERTRVNNADLTGIQAVIRSVAHFRGHTQEIIHITRTLRGDGYQFAGPR
jgi:hypothetical protein